MKIKWKIVLGITLLGTICFASISPAATSGQSRDEVEKIFATAKQLVYKQEWSRAARELERLVSDYPVHFRMEESLYWLAYSLNQSANGAAGRNRAIGFLERLLHRFPNGHWARQAKALLIDISGELARSGLKIFSQRLEEIENATEDLDIKLLALDSLMNTDSRPARERLRQILKSKGPAEQRQMALTILLQHDALDSTRELLQIIREDADDDLRFFALSQLQLIDKKMGLQELNRMTASGIDMKLKTRVLSLYLLAGDRNGSESLLRLANDKQQPESFRARAALLLAHTQTSDVVKHLERLFVNFALPDNRVRLARALGTIQSADAAAALIRLYEHETDTDVKKGIIMALGLTHQDAARRFLQQLLSQ